MLFTEDFYDSSDWALDYENALDANAMSSSDVNAWTVDLLAALNGRRRGSRRKGSDARALSRRDDGECLRRVILHRGTALAVPHVVFRRDGFPILRARANKNAQEDVTMKKLLALLAALAMLAASPAALAEDSTVYRLSVYDPIFYVNGEPAFDLTGLNVDLLAAVTDSGLNALIAELYTGEEASFAAAAQAQIDSEGLTFGPERPEKRLSRRPAEARRPARPFPTRSRRSRCAPRCGTCPPCWRTARRRLREAPRGAMNAVGVLFGDFVTETVTENGASTHAFEIPRETGRALLAEAAQILEQADCYFLTNISDFDVAGTIVATGNPANGAATPLARGPRDGSTRSSARTTKPSCPSPLSYFDDMASIDGALTLDDGSERCGRRGRRRVRRGLRRPANPAKCALRCRETCDGEETGCAEMRFAAEPDEGSARVDYSFEMRGSGGASAACVLSTNADPLSDESFELNIQLDAPEENLRLLDGLRRRRLQRRRRIRRLSRRGQFYANFDDGATAFGLDMFLGLFTEDFYDSSEWMLAPPRNRARRRGKCATADLAIAAMGFMGTLGNVCAALIEDVPELAPYVEAMLGALLVEAEEIPAFQLL